MILFSSNIREHRSLPCAVPSSQLSRNHITKIDNMATNKTLETRRQRVKAILPILKRTYPNAKCSLDYSNPLELLVATILSAQCTDDRVNIVTKSLFKKYKSAKDYASAAEGELEKDIQSTGFYRNKAKSLRGMGAALVELHNGKVPATMDELTALPGVGRKTANVVLGNAFDINVGVVVDTHVTASAIASA